MRKIENMSMKYELKTIPVWAFIKIAFFVNLVAGFILGLLLTPFVFLLLIFLIGLFQLQSTEFDFNGSIDTLMIAVPFVISFCCAFFLTLFEIVVVAIYNIFSKFMGGVVLNLQSAEPEYKTVKTVKAVVTPNQPKNTIIKTNNPDKVENYNHTGIDAPPPPPVIGGNQKSDENVLVPDEQVKKVENNNMTDKSVRVRIAPSPSGYLHVGTARMAIANFLFARHTKGQFLIRIENTDIARSDEAMIEPIISALEWLGITSDEEIIYQSNRTELYAKFARQILENDHGYRCFCSPDLLAADREEAIKNKGPLRYNRRCLNLTTEEIEQKLAAGDKYTIRLRIPEGTTTFNDLVSKELKRDNEEIEDFIIARSDGTATYNLAVVVDDHDMGITHVIRGNDHITNTFKQIHIYHALGFDLPVFGHVPLILRPDKKKVSKRLGDKDVAQYREEGILPEAMFNFLCLLGWSPKTDREIYSVDELIEIFNQNNFNTANSIFNEEKLEAFNKEHIFLKSDHDLAVEVAPLLVDAGYTTKYWLETRWEYLRDVISILKSRVRRISDFVELSKYFFDFDYKYDEKADEKNFTPDSRDILIELAKRFDDLEIFTKETVEECLSKMAEDKEIKKGQLIHPTRLAVSGVPQGPGLYDMLVLLGQKEVVGRMNKAADYIDNKNRD